MISALLCCNTIQKRNASSRSEGWGHKMKKFDALLYLSSVGAGIGMIAANLLSVYDVSGYSPAVLAASPVVAVRVVTADLSPAKTAALNNAPEQACTTCLVFEQQQEASIPSGTSKGRTLTSRELGGVNGVVVPVSGSGLQR